MSEQTDIPEPTAGAQSAGAAVDAAGAQGMGAAAARPAGSPPPSDSPAPPYDSPPPPHDLPAPPHDPPATPADFRAVRFDARGLVPCIVQEWTTGEVLMLAYMNAESLRRTLESGTTWFFSRSRNEYWNKGATSGHFQRVRELRYDCDGDTLLAIVEQTGAACHTGDFTCFNGRWLSLPTGEKPPFLSRREE